MLKLGAVRRSMGVTGARYVILNVFRTRAGRHKRDLLEIQCDNIIGRAHTERTSASPAALGPNAPHALADVAGASSSPGPWAARAVHRALWRIQLR